MNKIIFFLLFFSCLFLVSGCALGSINQSQEDGNKLDEILNSSLINNQDKSGEITNDAPRPKTEEKNKIDFQPLPGATYYRAPIDDVIGQVRVRFVNQQTNEPIPGFSVDCTACKDVYLIKDSAGKSLNVYPETDLDGWVTLNVTSNSPKIYAARSSHWFAVYFDNDLELGVDKTIYLDPHIIKAEETLIFPAVSYEKISPDKVQADITLKDKNQRAVTGHNILLNGSIYNGKRATANQGVDSSGRALIDLPINGPYRFQVVRQVPAGSRGEPTYTIYQFSVPTGYKAIISLTLN